MLAEVTGLVLGLKRSLIELTDIDCATRSRTHRDGEPFAGAGPLLHHHGSIKVGAVQRADGRWVAHGQGCTDGTALIHQLINLGLDR